MSDEHDDLLSFEIGEGEFDGTINEDELLLSDDDGCGEIEEAEPELIPEIDAPNSEEIISKSDPEVVAAEAEQSEIDAETDKPQNESTPKEQNLEILTSDTGQKQDATIVETIIVKSINEDKNLPEGPFESEQIRNGPQVIRNTRPMRGKFLGPYNRRPQWNPMGPGGPIMPPQQFQRHPGMMPGGVRHMMPGRPPMNNGPIRQPMRPGLAQGPFFNHFGPVRPMQRPQGPPISGQRIMFNTFPGPVGGPILQTPSYVPSPITQPAAPVMARKVLINPNFKGGVEAATNQLLKDQFYNNAGSGAVPEDELLRKQQEFINRNMRCMEKRRHERTPSPNYSRYSHSPSPPSHRRRAPPSQYNRYNRKDNISDKPKDENLPEEDEETRAYRQQIETQRRKREEIIRAKEMRRKQQAEQKAKDKEPEERLQPIVVTDKKIILKKARIDESIEQPEKSTTPPLTNTIATQPTTPSSRRIVLKPSKDTRTSAAPTASKVSLADGSKRKIQNILKGEV